MPDGFSAPPKPLAYLTAGMLAAAMPRCRNPQGWAEPLRAACVRFSINNRLRVAAFLAQIGHESDSLNRLSESLDYSPAALATTWPKRFPLSLAMRLGRVPGRPADQRAIAEACYGGRMGNSVAGDAWTYRGAGLIQLTGFANHNACAEAFGLPTAEMPLWLRTAEGASLSAAWFWQSRGLNELADAEDTDAISRRINGGDNGLADRRHRYVLARRALLPW
jgi:putative chitinase